MINWYLVIFIISGNQALNITCPNIDDICKTDSDELPPYKASNNRCWSKKDDKWTCDTLKVDGKCSEDTTNVDKCKYKIPKDRCPTIHDSCIDGDMLISPGDPHAPRCWATTEDVGHYTCKNLSNCNKTLNYFDIGKCVVEDKK